MCKVGRFDFWMRSDAQHTDVLPFSLHCQAQLLGYGWQQTACFLTYIFHTIRCHDAPAFQKCAVAAAKVFGEVEHE